MTVTATLVAGPPCSGKNYYVAHHKDTGDLVVDFDALMYAVGGDDYYSHPAALKRYVYEARDAVLRTWLGRKDVDLWVVLGAPKRADREWYARRGFRVVVMDADRATCLRRARLERPRLWQQYVANYFTAFEAPPVTDPVPAGAPPLASVSRRW